MKNLFKITALFAVVLMIFCITGCGDNAGGNPSGNTPAQTPTPAQTSAEPTMQETPLTLEAIAAGTITLTNPWSTLKYKKNGGDFVSVTASANTIAVAAGDKVAFYADGSENTSNLSTYTLTALRINCSSDCFVYGNVMSLLSSSDFKNATSISTEYAFAELFLYSDGSVYTNTHIKNHAQKALVLPATTLAAGCYREMFEGCTGLTSAPVLPATTLAANCYCGMFYGCTSLTSAPALPATTLAANCYYGMFNGCTSLSSVTCLATNISASNCTTNWLAGVASTGTFKKVASMDDWTTNSVSGIPTGWTVQDYTAQ